MNISLFIIKKQTKKNNALDIYYKKQPGNKEENKMKMKKKIVKEKFKFGMQFFTIIVSLYQFFLLL